RSARVPPARVRWRSSLATTRCQRLYLALSGDESAAHDPQVVDQPAIRLLAICRPQDGARVDGRDHEVGQLGIERLAALLRHLEGLAEERLGGGRAHQDER